MIFSSLRVIGIANGIDGRPGREPVIHALRLTAQDVQQILGIQPLSWSPKYNSYAFLTRELSPSFEIFKWTRCGTTAVGAYMYTLHFELNLLL